MKTFLTIFFTIIVHCLFAQSIDEYLMQVEKALENGDKATARAIFEKLIESDSSPLNYYLQKSVGYNLDEEELKKGLAMFDKLIQFFPDKYLLYNGRGNLRLKLREYDDALNDFTKAFELTENDSLKCLTMSDRATVKMGTRDFEGAYQDLLTAYELDATYIGALVNLGGVCNQLGKQEEALRYLLEAVEIDPLSFHAYGNIGFIYQDLEQHEKAIEYYNKVLEIKPDEPLGYSNRSFNRLKLGDTKGALKDIQKSIKLFPANSYAYRIRALIYIEMRKKKKACKDLQTALDKQFTLRYGDEVIRLQEKHCN